MTNVLRRAAGTVGRYLADIGGTSTVNPARWFVDWVRDGAETDSGVPVNYKSALHYSTIWQAVNIISGDLGQLPLVLYKRTPEGRTIANTHPSYRVMRRRANSWMNSNTFKECIQAHALLSGNGRAGILRDTRGRVLELIPFLPDRSHEEMIDGKVWHLTKLGADEKETAFPDSDVFHVKGLGYDGITGYDVVSFAKNSFGLGIAQEKHGNRTFRNQARPSVVLETAQTFTREAALQLLDDWQNMVAGLDNAGRTALLQRGVTAKALSVANDNAQWLESRIFQRQEIASWFNLPPHKVGDSSKVAYNSIEQENLSYLNSTLMRWIVAWEEECFEKLLSEEEKAREEYEFSFDTEALLRGDLKSRYAAYMIGISSEFLSPNEVREKEFMNRRTDPGGDEYRNPNTKSAGDESDSKDDDAKDSTRHNAVQGRVAGMIRVECRRIESAAATSKNFLAWLDSFYERWNVRLEAVVRELGCAESVARDYCNESRRLLLEQSGRSTADTLAADVKRLASNWEKERADDLAADILWSMTNA